MYENNFDPKINFTFQGYTIEQLSKKEAKHLFQNGNGPLVEKMCAYALKSHKLEDMERALFGDEYDYHFKTEPLTIDFTDYHFDKPTCIQIFAASDTIDQSEESNLLPFLRKKAEVQVMREII